MIVYYRTKLLSRHGKKKTSKKLESLMEDHPSFAFFLFIHAEEEEFIF
jgi:hypothetical protein